MCVLRIFAATFICTLLAVTLATGARAERRVALVIGNSNYTEVSPLTNPKNDAELMAKTLQSLGFEVTKLINADQRTMKQAMLDFGRALRGGVDASLFYYAGHGIQANGENYLVPVDAVIKDEGELDLQAIDVNAFLRVMEASTSKVNVVVLDACRTNPFAGSFRSLSNGLAMVEAPRGTYIAYSTAPDKVAEDGAAGNSPYTAALVQAMLEPGNKLEDTFKKARRQVLEATHDKQVPWETSSITGDFYFQPPSATASGSPQVAGFGNGDPGETAWTRIANSNDPVDFSSFVRFFPDSSHRAEAQARANDLKWTSECDLLASSPLDPDRPAGTTGTKLDELAQNAGRAIPACQKAVEARPDNRRLAFELGRALGSASRFEEAGKSYEKAAALGSATAMNNLGSLYEKGQGVAKDYGEARKWLEKAAALGLPMAMYHLALVYDDGEGVPQDYAEARKWYEKAAALGEADAMYSLGSLYDDGHGVRQDYGEARKWYEKAAALGVANAMYNLGFLYRDGHGGPQDYAGARKWYEKAASLGLADAMYNLGFLYRDGHGGPQDYAEARKWYEKAAALGMPEAMYGLGLLYDQGQGVRQDYGEARRWFEKAAALGVADAMYALGLLYDNGQGVAQDYGEARKWYAKAAALGVGSAMYNLGLLYNEGQGGAQDYGEARKWYEKAVAHGEAKALHSLANLYTDGHGVARDIGRASQLYVQALIKRVPFTFDQFRTNSDAYPIEVLQIVQSFLIDQGYLSGTPDGVFNSATLAALDAFQKSGGAM